MSGQLNDKFRQDVIDETLNTFDLLQNEYNIPPMFSCLTMGRYCLINVLAAFQRQGIEPPKEFVDFLEKTMPQLVEIQDEFMTEQYLTLNTSGTA